MIEDNLGGSICESDIRLFDRCEVDVVNRCDDLFFQRVLQRNVIGKLLLVRVVDMVPCTYLRAS